MQKQDELIRIQQTFDGILCQSSLMQEVYRKIRSVAEEDITVLIIGESGTGKELAARAIHNCSTRSSGPFVPVNMGALAKEIAPSEIFGHEKGSFTGATGTRQGIFEIAENGTLFLDEVGSMDYRTQTTLLRILENREFHRVGGTEKYRTNARIIAATMTDLHLAVQEKLFRRDLLYRLEVFVITMPPLRDHTEDIPVLVDHFIALFNDEMKKKYITGISPEALDCLKGYIWPGNIRELKNVIQRTMLLTEGDIIKRSNIIPLIFSENPNQQKTGIDIVPGLSLKDVEKRYIHQTLVLTKGNKSEAAKILGVSRRYLYNKIRQYNIPAVRKDG